MHLNGTRKPSNKRLYVSAIHPSLCWATPYQFTSQATLLARHKKPRSFLRPRGPILAMTNHLQVHKEALKNFAPCLTNETYKGQGGRIAIVGGSAEYTGAPYFAAIAAMRAGAELAFVYTTPDAAAAIKSYSPDLIVYPGFAYLGEDCSSLDRMHAIVVGPGIGRGEIAAAVVEKVVQYACKCRKPLIIDADALFFLSQSSSLRNLIKGASGFICATPNAIEMNRILSALHVATGEEIVSFFGDRFVLVEKGETDFVFGSGSKVDVSDVEGALKRVGGQGDFLAGVCALFCAWATAKGRRVEPDVGDIISAAVCACIATKSAAKQAFHKFKRGMLASDIIIFLADEVGDLLSEKV